MEERRVRQRVSLLPRLVKAVRRLIYITRAYTRNIMRVYVYDPPYFRAGRRPDSPVSSRFFREPRGRAARERAIAYYNLAAERGFRYMFR